MGLLTQILGGLAGNALGRRGAQPEARSGLSELLPEVVDHFTPGGSLPAGEQLSASVDDYLQRLS